MAVLYGGTIAYKFKSYFQQEENMKTITNRSSHKGFLLFALALQLVTISSQSKTNDDRSIQIYLKEFHADPKKSMARHPQQIIKDELLNREDIEYIDRPQAEYRQKLRDEVRARGKTQFSLSLPTENDLAASIVENGTVTTNLATLDSLKVTSATLVQIPWTDSYWPIAKGLIGIRYSDPSFPDSKSFEINYNYFLSSPPDAIVSSNNPNEIDQLSPAEKYDLMVGDSNWTMTQYSWAQGRQYFAQNGGVPNWMGICHGWAAASHMGAPVSSKPILITSANGTSIKFYPSDIKALQSMLWANASPPTRFVGSKCTSSNPERNAIGRVIEPICLDSNPATFHLIMTNQLGINRRSFIIDGTYDLEVWNFPVVSYKFKYFNPQTLEPTLDFRKATVAVNAYHLDKFKEFRSPLARYVIGIAMDTTYIVEIAPNRGAQLNSPNTTFRHFYDLEMDSSFNIIGGEWYANAHPDFIWTYDTTAMATSITDSFINSDDWISPNSFPVFWLPYVQKASARGQPISGIIRALLSRETF